MQEAIKSIILFGVLVLALPLFNSQKVILWDSPRESNQADIFHSFVFSYASKVEDMKRSLSTKAQEIKVVDTSADSTSSLQNQALPPQSIDKPITSVDPATSATSIQNQVKEINPLSPYRFLLVGDSFMAVMGGVGDILESSLLKYKSVEVLRVGKVSSGLSRPDYFDWPNQARQIITNSQPNVAIVMLGTNDAQSFETYSTDGVKTIFKYGTQQWGQEYRKRVREFLEIFQANNITVYWIGMPIMRDPSYSERIRGLNLIYEQEILNFSNARFIPTRDLLVDSNGNYASSLTDFRGRQMATRVADGIHLTVFAGEIVEKQVIKIVGEDITLEDKY
ncbi:MAG: DUF459 domain-containing protein [Candidatus Gribaldobacteria bacterium]|nr:DUF459 domain-containing protein [Candidatus Gribaldobacteria bacterium]